MKSENESGAPTQRPGYLIKPIKNSKLLEKLQELKELARIEVRHYRWHVHLKDVHEYYYNRLTEILEGNEE